MTTKPPLKNLHPRNLHNNGYDFPALIRTSPGLKKHVKTNKYGAESVDFANPEAVKALNCALLQHDYGIEEWNIPPGYLCPPIPGRIDYIHYVADLLESSGIISSSTQRVRLLDIGIGANGIYSLLACRVYGWYCTGSDIDQLALDNVAAIVGKNPALQGSIDLRLQRNRANIFERLIASDDYFDVSVCNPPFHASPEEAQRMNQRKVNKLAFNRKEKPANTSKPLLNFGGQKRELWCEGGESQFLRTMMKESKVFGQQCRWFTTLISKAENVGPAKKLLRELHAADILEVEMHQGNKTTRVVAWSFTT